MRLNSPALALACGLLSAGANLAADAASEYQVKAAFLLNFPNFVEWPAGAFRSASEPLVLGIFGRDPFAGALDQMASGKTINGRPLQIRLLTDLGTLRNCHMVFFPASHAQGVERAIAELADFGVLTVGEKNGFAERGGVINFVIDDHHVSFEVNPAAAEHRRLKLSSKLLQLAIIIGNSPRSKAEAALPARR